MQNVSAAQFWYGTGEKRRIRLLLKSKHSIANIFLNKRQRIFVEVFTLALTNKLYVKRLMSSLHLLLSHILQHCIFQTIHLIHPMAKEGRGGGEGRVDATPHQFFFFNFSMNGKSFFATNF